MTTAADLRADALADLKGEGNGQPISFVPASSGGSAPGGTYDFTSGNVTPAPTGEGGATPAVLTGFGRVTRFSDTLAAGGLIKDQDRKIVWYPDDPTVKPDIDGEMIVTLADGSTETYQAVAINARTLGGAIVHWIVQARR